MNNIDYSKVVSFILGDDKNARDIANVLKEAGLVSSTSEAFRMIQQGAVKINGEKIEDRDLVLNAGANYICQVGKRRFANVILK